MAIQPFDKFFNKIFDKLILNNPSLTDGFSKLYEARKARSFLKCVALQFKEYFPNKSFGRLLKACIINTDSKNYSEQINLLFSFSSSSQEAFDLIIECVHFLLELHDITCPETIRSDYLANASAILDKLNHLKDITKGKKFTPGRKKGALSAKTHPILDHILELRKQYPDLKAKQLVEKANKAIIGSMSEKTFYNILSKNFSSKT